MKYVFELLIESFFKTIWFQVLRENSYLVF